MESRDGDSDKLTQKIRRRILGSLGSAIAPGSTFVGEREEESNAGVVAGAREAARARNVNR